MHLNTLHYITIVGNKYIGKKQIIKNIISGKHLHPSLPRINKDTQLVNCNNKFYGYKINPLDIFKSIKNIKRSAYIVVDTTNIQSINSIPFWYNKLRVNKMETDNIFIILIKKDNECITSLSLHHYIIQFCTLNKIKLININ